MNSRPAPRLVAITDRATADERTTLERFAVLGRAARPQSVVFQLRDFGSSARERLAFGVALLGVARDTGQLLVVNDHLDIAGLLAADGVHLGEASVTTADARRLLGERVFVSRACHEPSQLAELDADAVLLSPILEARKARPALGASGLERARALSEGREARPLLFALGGISPELVGTCLSAGADGVAAMGAVLNGDGVALVRALGIER